MQWYWLNSAFTYIYKYMWFQERERSAALSCKYLEYTLYYTIAIHVWQVTKSHLSFWIGYSTDDENSPLSLELWRKGFVVFYTNGPKPRIPQQPDCEGVDMLYWALFLQEDISSSSCARQIIKGFISSLNLTLKQVKSSNSTATIIFCFTHFLQQRELESTAKNCCLLWHVLSSPLS